MEGSGRDNRVMGLHNAGLGGQWFEAKFAPWPMVSLVYPSVYP